jgi:hypothetical protein
LTTVGFAQSPEIAGKGGLIRVSSFPSMIQSMQFLHHKCSSSTTMNIKF